MLSAQTPSHGAARGDLHDAERVYPASVMSGSHSPPLCIHKCVYIMKS